MCEFKLLYCITTAGFYILGGTFVSLARNGLAAPTVSAPGQTLWLPAHKGQAPFHVFLRTPHDLGNGPTGGWGGRSDQRVCERASVAVEVEWVAALELVLYDVLLCNCGVDGAWGGGGDQMAEKSVRVRWKPGWEPDFLRWVPPSHGAWPGFGWLACARAFESVQKLCRLVCDTGRALQGCTSCCDHTTVTL